MVINIPKSDFDCERVKEVSQKEATRDIDGEEVVEAGNKETKSNIDGL